MRVYYYYTIITGVHNKSALKESLSFNALSLWTPDYYYMFMWNNYVSLYMYNTIMYVL